MKPGIERIEIIDEVNGRGAYRFEQPKRAHPHANQIYRSIFDLNPGETVIRCQKDDKYGGYDMNLGIDLLLNFANGMTTPLQEKILTWHESTVTVEYMQDPNTGEEGDWFKPISGYYFVGYARADSTVIEEWILLDWNKIKLNANRIPWDTRPNKRDGAKSNFKYAYFIDMPEECIVASNYDRAQCELDASNNPIRQIKVAACPEPAPRPEPRKRENLNWAINAQVVQMRFSDPIFFDAWLNEQEHKQYNDD